METESLTHLDRRIMQASEGLNTPAGQALFETLLAERRKRTFPFLDVLSERLRERERRSAEWERLRYSIIYQIEKRRRREERRARILKFFGLR